VAKANAEALCPDGSDGDIGIRTQRSLGTLAMSRSGRLRAKSGFTTTLLTAEDSPTLARPRSAARRAGRPPTIAMAAAQPSHSRE
jgi:hypothetical protein